MEQSVERACRMLEQADHITILAHQKPDGDTLGSSFALLKGLQSMGKTARVRCSDGFPPRYRVVTGDYTSPEFREEFVVAVDVADLQLLGPLREEYEGKIDLCIDHHPSNTHYARELLLWPKAASAAEVIYQVLLGLGVSVTGKIADCVYTGVATDTGCFRFGNTTGNSHRVAAALIDAGADAFTINRLMFDTNSRERLAVECKAKSGICYYYGGQCAVMFITPEMLRGPSVTDFDLEGFSTMPRAIEGVEVGVTIREKEDGECRVSLRSSQRVNVSEVCQKLGGGGHTRAAGCTIQGGRDAARDKVLAQLAGSFPGLSR